MTFCVHNFIGLVFCLCLNNWWGAVEKLLWDHLLILLSNFRSNRERDASAIKKNKSLHSLVLNENFISDGGAMELADALAPNGTLQVIGLKENNSPKVLLLGKIKLHEFPWKDFSLKLINRRKWCIPIHLVISLYHKFSQLVTQNV